MNSYHPIDGSYFVCPQCNKVDYPLYPKAGKEDNKENSAPRTANVGNTYLIDKEIEEELDRVVERGRD